MYSQNYPSRDPGANLYHAKKAMTVNLSPSDPGWAYFTLEAIGEDIDGTISPEFSMLDVYVCFNLHSIGPGF